MLKTLIAVEPDLPSRLAIRVVCQLKNEIDMYIHLIHVIDSARGGIPVGGTGWVHNTWMQSVSQQSREKVIQMVKREKQTGFPLDTPQFIEGQREQSLIHELSVSSYDLFVEGIFHSFLPHAFLQKLRSDLYQKMACPILMVKNLVSLEKGIVIAGDTPEGLEESLHTFFKLFSQAPLKPTLLLCRFAETSDTALEPFEKKIKEEFERQGKSYPGIKSVKGDIEMILPYVNNRAMVIAEFPQENSAMEELLSQVPSPILFCKSPQDEHMRSL